MSRITAITNAKGIDGPIVIDGDLIASIGGAIPDGAEILDANGAHIAPGIVDLGVFAIDKSAFIVGGITRVALMPDQRPVLDDPGIVQRSALAAKPDLWVHPLAAATRGLEGRELAEYAMMQRAGAKAVATGRSWIADSGVMMKVLAYAAALDLTVITHAEDGGLTASAVATSGETATRLGLTSAPACAEALAIARDLTLVRETGARLHFRHVTTDAGFGLIRAAKAQGLPISCGTSPAYWMLSDIAISDFRTFGRLSPPLRSESDRLATRKAIGDGTVDILCSSHDPRGPEAKRLPFADAEPGMAGAQTLLSFGLGLVREKVVSMGRLFDMLSTNPSKLLKVNSGILAPGAPADIILFDPDLPWQIDGSKFVGSAGNTPFDKLPVQGRVLHTMKGGRLLS